MCLCGAASRDIAGGRRGHFSCHCELPKAARLYDVGVDAVGVILGVLFFLLCRRLLTRKNK